MCPEPVAPGYEYSDVVEEVVKLHPPVGQLLLEEIERLVAERDRETAHMYVCAAAWKRLHLKHLANASEHRVYL